MTLTIEIPDHTLAALQADAGAQGRSAAQVAAEHLAALYAYPDDEEAAVNEALDELEAGQSRPLADFAEEQRAHFRARHGLA